MSSDPGARSLRGLTARAAILGGALALVICGIALSAPSSGSRSRAGHAGGAPSTNRDRVYDLRAIPGGPYTVTRGGVVQLDGSHSTPADRITAYRWSFTAADCPGIPLHPNAVKMGMRTTVVALCSIKATLTVTDDLGDTSPPVSATITVTARRFKPIPFDQSRVVHQNLTFADGVFSFGANLSIEGWRSNAKLTPSKEKADQWLDPREDPVEVSQVNDPQGPFNGIWYVAGDRLHVERVLVINKRFLPGGDIYNMQGHGSHRHDLARLLAATKTHEQIHGTLVATALRKGDAGRLQGALEQATGPDRAALLEKTSGLVRAAETELKEASSDSNVHAEMRERYRNSAVHIVVPTSGVDAVRKFVVAEVGDL